VRFILLILLAAGLLAACAEDKQPYFPPTDVDLSDLGSGRDEGEPVTCTNHSECGSGEVCFERECVDIDDVIDDCWDDSDCPDGWVCVDEDHCEEE
jgi:hypothetical protein